MLEKLLKWDRDTFIYLNNLGIEEYDQFWLTVTNFSTWIPLFLFIIFLLFFRNSRKEGAWKLLSFFSMMVILTIVIFTTKYTVARLRPSNDETLNTLIRILQNPGDYSFFSGHAASSFAITTLAILFLKKKYGWIYFMLIWPLLFSISRIYVGVHYPLDLLVGMLVGVLFAYIFYRMHQKFKAPYIM